MSSPYREGSHPAGKIACPRCQLPLPPLDVATCNGNCGTWVTAEVANIALVADELVEDRLTRWWRVRAPCPVCAEPMTLRGLGDGMFQGCTQHGYFLDADIIKHTGLGRTNVVEEVEQYRASIEQARVDEMRRAAEQEAQARAKADADRIAEEQRRERDAAQLAEAERQRAEKRAAKEKREADKRAKAEQEAAEIQARRERKAAAKRAAADQERAQGEERRATLMARVNEAIASGNGAVLVEEIVRLDERVAAIEKKFQKLQQHVSWE